MEGLPRYDRDNPESINRYKKAYQEQYQKKYRKQRKIIRLSVDEETYSRIKGLANSENKTMAGLIMGSLVGWENKQASLNRTGRDVLKELGRIGTNINQIARVINTKKLTSLWMKKELDGLREEVMKIRKMMINAKN